MVHASWPRRPFSCDREERRVHDCVEETLEHEEGHVSEKLKPIDAFTFDEAHTVASVEGKSTSTRPPKDNWRYVELSVDSSAVDSDGDPKSFPENMV